MKRGGRLVGCYVEEDEEVKEKDEEREK